MEEDRERTEPPPDEVPDESGEGSSTASPKPNEVKGTPPKRDPVRRITQGVLLLVAVVFVWYLFADRLTPYTDQGRIQALLTPIVPQVGGYLTEVNDQWRMIFRWTPSGPAEVDIRDYH
jgi:hypothetical protein